MTRDASYIIGVDEMEIGSRKTFSVSLPEGTSPEDWTYAHSVAGGASVTILGATDEFEVTVQADGGDVGDQTFTLTTILTAI